MISSSLFSFLFFSPDTHNYKSAWAWADGSGAGATVAFRRKCSKQKDEKQKRVDFTGTEHT